ncbi:hypothetical protein [Rhodococcus sp. As11]|uniref:hypothetical protein n=1 Tax=Rhodococcus sp. As11 TaxID=3029189 RepID=UPI003B823958
MAHIDSVHLEGAGRIGGAAQYRLFGDDPAARRVGNYPPPWRRKGRGGDGKGQKMLGRNRSAGRVVELQQDRQLPVEHPQHPAAAADDTGTHPRA